jgi:Tfp pilus assembly protein PilV
MLNRAGHSLVEVLVAGLVLLTGVVPATAALGHSMRWATLGRARTIAAIAAQDRLDQLRSVALETDPLCTGLADGSADFDNRSERWTVETIGLDRRVMVVVTVALPARAVADTLVLLVPCG